MSVFFIDESTRVQSVQERECEIKKAIRHLKKYYCPPSSVVKEERDEAIKSLSLVLRILSKELRKKVLE